MAKFEIVFKQSVAKDLRCIPKQDVAPILASIHGLADDPRPQGARKLSALERYRIGQGIYRILYEIQDRRLIVMVIKAGDRREVYRSQQ